MATLEEIRQKRLAGAEKRTQLATKVGTTYEIPKEVPKAIVGGDPTGGAIDILTGKPYSERQAAYRPLMEYDPATSKDSVKATQVVGSGIQKTLTRGSEAGFQVVGMARDGLVDQWFTPTVIINSFMESYMGKSYTPASDMVDWFARKDPFFSEITKQVRQGIEPAEGTPLAEYRKALPDILRVRDEAELVTQEWAQVSVLDSDNIFEGVSNVGKLMASQTEVMTSLMLPAGIGVVNIFGLMQEEYMQSTQQAFEERGEIFDPEEFKDLADIYGVFGGLMERASAGISLKAMMGKNLFSKTVASGSITKAIGMTAGGQLVGAGVEGGTEGGQSLLNYWLTNVALARHAKATGGEYIPIPKEEIIEGTARAIEMGVFTAGGFQAVGAPAQFTHAYETAVVHKMDKKFEEEMSPAEVTEVVQAYAHNAKVYGDEALTKTDSELRTQLEEEENHTLYNLVKSIDMTKPLGPKEEMVDFIMDNRIALPDYRVRAMENLLEVIDINVTDNVQKNFHKWMAQGDIGLADMVQLKKLMTAVLKNSEMGGTLEEYFDDAVALQGDKQGYLDFNRMGEWFVFGADAFDIGKADILIAETKPEPVLINPREAKDLNSRVVQIDPKTMMQADITKPVIIGTLPDGGRILIDGNHRAERAIFEKEATIPAYVLTAEQTASIAHEASVSFNQTGTYQDNRGGRPKYLEATSDKLKGRLVLLDMLETQLRYMDAADKGEALANVIVMAQRMLKNPSKEVHDRGSQWLGVLTDVTVDDFAIMPTETGNRGFRPLNFNQAGDVALPAGMEGAISTYTKREGGSDRAISDNIRDASTLFYYGEVGGLKRLFPEAGFALLDLIERAEANKERQAELSEEQLTFLQKPSTSYRDIPELSSDLIGELQDRADVYNTDPDRGVTEGDELLTLWDFVEDVTSFLESSPRSEWTNVDRRWMKEIQDLYVRLGVYKPLTKFELQNMVVSSGPKYDFIRGGQKYAFSTWDVDLPTTPFFSDPFTLYQSGRHLISGNRVIRGRAQVTAENKFVIDLFKTGDVLTLAHEFAHAISPHLSNEVRDALIEDIYQNDTSIDRENYTRIWNLFKRNPAQAKQFLNPEELATLTEIQEHLASSFEGYLTGEIAPNSAFIPVFKVFRDRHIQYYRDIRKEKVQYQRVNPAIASVFDNLIAGDDVVLQRDFSTTVTMKDDEGVVHTYTTHKSRPQNDKHKVLLKYLEKGFKNWEGAQEQVADYARAMLGKISGERAAREGKAGEGDLKAPTKKEMVSIYDKIKLIGGKREALRVMQLIDIELAKRQEQAHTTQIARIKKTLRKFRSKGGSRLVDPLTRQVAERMVEDIDLKSRSDKRLRRTMGLAKLITDTESHFGEVTATLKGLQDIADLDKRNITSFSAQELDILEEALSDMLRYDIKMHEDFLAAKDKERTVINRRFSAENNGNKRYQVRMGKKAMGKRAGGIEAMRKTSGFLNSPIRNMRALAWGENSIWDKLSDDIINGRYEQYKLKHQFEDAFREIAAGVPTHGVSTDLGTVAQSEYLPLTVINEQGETVEIEVTKAQLMLWYGYAQNKKSLRHLMEGGFRLRQGKEILVDDISVNPGIKAIIQKKVGKRFSKDQETKAIREIGEEDLFKFRSSEELVSIVSQLDLQYKQVVDQTMQYYDEVVYPLLNEAYQKINGISLEKEQNYLPLFVEWKGKELTETLSIKEIGATAEQWYRKRLRNLEFLNARKGGAHPLYAADFFSGVPDNLNKVARYVGMTEPVMEARIQIFGGAESANVKDTGRPSPSFQTVKMLGRVQYRLLSQWLDDIEDPSPRRDGDFTRWALRTHANVRTSILKIAPSIAVIQLPSALLARNYGITRLELTRAMTRQLFAPRHTIQNLMDLHPMMRERFEHVPMVEMDYSSQAHSTRQFWVQPSKYMEQLASVRSGRDFRDLLKRTEDSTLLTLKYMDARALSIIYDAVQLKGKKSGATDQQILDQFLLIVQRTQPMNDPVFTSRFLGEKDTWRRILFGPFQSQRDALRGEIQTNLMEAQNTMWGQGKKAYTLRKCAGNMVRTMIISNAIVSALQEVSSRVGADDEDYPSYLTSWLGRMFTNNLSLIPMFGDFVSYGFNKVTRDWGGSPIPLLLASPAESFWDEVVKGNNELEKGNTGKASEHYYKAILEGARWSGKSWANIDKWVDKTLKELDIKD